MGEFSTLPNLFWLFGSFFVPCSIPWVILKLYRYFQLKSKLHGKVVLITGASSGLGEALAHVFYKSGCCVILAARREAELERVKRDLLALRMAKVIQITKDIVSHPPVVMLLDLAKIEEIPAQIEKILKIVGRIDILINNAGVSYRGEVLTTNVTVDQEIMLINYIAQVALIKAVLPSMVLQKSGHIVAISSLQGRLALPFRSAYTASKHALQAFCDTLRAEIAHQNIHVTVVSPSYIRTNLSVNALTGTGEKYGVVDETTAQGFEPSSVAKSVLAAVLARRPQLTISELAPQLAILLRTIWPSAYCYIMRQRAQKLRRNALLPGKL